VYDLIERGVNPNSGKSTRQTEHVLCKQSGAGPELLSALNHTNAARRIGRSVDQKSRKVMSEARRVGLIQHNLACQQARLRGAVAYVNGLSKELSRQAASMSSSERLAVIFEGDVESERQYSAYLSHNAQKRRSAKGRRLSRKEISTLLHRSGLEKNPGPSSKDDESVPKRRVIPRPGEREKAVAVSLAAKLTGKPASSVVDLSHKPEVMRATMVPDNKLVERTTNTPGNEVAEESDVVALVADPLGFLHSHLVSQMEKATAFGAGYLQNLDDDLPLRDREFWHNFLLRDVLSMKLCDAEMSALLCVRDLLKCRAINSFVVQMGMPPGSNGNRFKFLSDQDGAPVLNGEFVCTVTVCRVELMLHDMRRENHRETVKTTSPALVADVAMEIVPRGFVKYDMDLPVQENLYRLWRSGVRFTAATCLPISMSSFFGQVRRTYADTVNFGLLYQNYLLGGGDFGRTMEDLKAAYGRDARTNASPHHAHMTSRWAACLMHLRGSPNEIMHPGLYMDIVPANVSQFSNRLRQILWFASPSIVDWISVLSAFCGLICLLSWGVYLWVARQILDALVMLCMALRKE